MLKYYDTECKRCGTIKEILVDNEKMPVCEECGGELKRLFTTFNFKLVYNNKTDCCAWGDNNYESSQYYRKIKEARAQGLDAHAPEE